MTLSELYVGCRTYRRFEQRPLPDGLLRAVLENARIASTGANAQTLRFIAVQSSALVAQMQPLVRWAAYLPKEIGTPAEGERPVALSSSSKKPVRARSPTWMRASPPTRSPRRHGRRASAAA